MAVSHVLLRALRESVGHCIHQASAAPHPVGDVSPAAVLGEYLRSGECVRVVHDNRAQLPTVEALPDRIHMIQVVDDVTTAVEAAPRGPVLLPRLPEGAFSVALVGRDTILPALSSAPPPPLQMIRCERWGTLLAGQFDVLWGLLADDRPTLDRPDLSGPLREVLEVLESGVKDEVACRQLGLSQRTFSRRARELLSRLGAATRFQAGMEAVRRGWL